MKKPNTPKALTDHFFRHEYSKMVAVISRYFGLNKLDLAEDIVQDTLLEAMKNWEYNGIPPNPEAWLYKVAKNKAINAIKKSKFESTEWPKVDDSGATEDLFDENKIQDDMLRMMFACCHPSIKIESQTALILKTLCGFTIDEIATAYLSNSETINKRLVRARKTLKEAEIELKLPSDSELSNRLDAVLHSIYLLFNEGYNASSGDQLIRYDLCREAIRLAKLIAGHDLFKANSTVHALIALMFLNASRFRARITSDGQLIRMENQDRKLWDQRLINSGLEHLEKITKEKTLSHYHILATISAHYCTAIDYDSTDWVSILQLYDVLIKIDNSVVVQVNRVIALAKVKGAERALQELEAIPVNRLVNYYHYHTVKADLLTQTGKLNQAKTELQTASKLTSNNAEVQHLRSKLGLLEK
ncbi:MAG: sigma-70 family RNA polymerase sigma factor [Cyclobacteriaceae bacterium]